MREETLQAWLSQSEWAAWQRSGIAGDASARRYERLHDTRGRSVILMDAPPETCGSQSAFVTLARHLRAAGLCAPDIHAWDDDLGLLILSDLGITDFAGHLSAKPEDEAALYSAATDVLRALAQVPVIKDLTVMTPDVGAQMLDPAFDWASTDASPEIREDIKGEMRALLHSVSPQPATLSLRDFHAENLIWRERETGTARVGLLDFQDAFVTHGTYDLASLLRDARRDVSDDLLPVLLRQLDPTADQDQQQATFHVMAVQRNLRILGIFHKLAKEGGKPRYLEFLPRVKAHLARDLSHPVLTTLEPLVTRMFLGGPQ